MKKLCIVLVFLVASSVQATNFDQANKFIKRDYRGDWDFEI